MTTCKQLLKDGNDNNNDNHNILFDHNIQIEIIMYNSLKTNNKIKL